MLAFLCTALVLGVGAATADNYADPSGDAGGGPDVAGVTVTDDAAGTITISVTVLLAAGNQMNFGIDPDANCVQPVCSVGSWWTKGTGKWILVDASAPGVVSARAGPLDSSGNAHLSSSFAPGLEVTATPTTVELRLPKAAFGIDKGFGFLLGTVVSAGQVLWSDEAPDGQTHQGDTEYGYTLTTASTQTSTPAATSAPTRNLTVLVYPLIGKPVIVPPRVAAGRRLTISAPVARGDNRKPLTGGTMVCTPSAAGKTIGHTQLFSHGIARCSFLVPSADKGKRLTVKLMVKATSYRGKDGSYVDLATGQIGTTHIRYSGQSATKILTFPIH